MDTPVITERIEVESSNIKDIGYKDQVLEITFKRGGRYRYFGVSPEIWNGFRVAASKGRFFHQIIKGQFREELVYGGGQDVQSAT